MSHHHRRDPATPPPPKTTNKSSRPLPPWPVSPASYSSPEMRGNGTPVCPGAPTKAKASRSRLFRDDNEDDDEETSRYHRGIRPRRLNFDDVADHDDLSDHEGNDASARPHPHSPLASPRDRSDDSYPILHMSVGASPPSSPLRPRSSRTPSPPNDGEEVPPSMGVVQATPPRRGTLGQSLVRGGRSGGGRTTVGRIGPNRSRQGGSDWKR